MTEKEETVEEGRNLLEFAAPIHIGGGFAGIMRLGFSTDETEQILDKNQWTIFIFTGFIMLIAFLSMWLLYKNQNSYLGKMQEMQRRMDQAKRLSAWAALPLVWLMKFAIRSMPSAWRSKGCKRTTLISSQK